jgi:dihydrofolate reductase
LVKAHIEGDTFFPAMDLSNWKEKSRTKFSKNEKNEYDFEIVELSRNIETS